MDVARKRGVNCPSWPRVSRTLPPGGACWRSAWTMRRGSWWRAHCRPRRCRSGWRPGGANRNSADRNPARHRPAGVAHCSHSAPPDRGRSGAGGAGRSVLLDFFPRAGAGVSRSSADGGAVDPRRHCHCRPGAAGRAIARAAGRGARVAAAVRRGGAVVGAGRGRRAGAGRTGGAGAGPETPPPLEGGGWGEGSVGAKRDRPLPPTPSLKGRGSILALHHSSAATVNVHPA